MKLDYDGGWKEFKGFAFWIAGSLLLISIGAAMAGIYLLVDWLTK